ncbi:MAG: thermonuclease family protein [Pseudomonadota bacterium]
MQRFLHLLVILISFIFSGHSEAKNCLFSSKNIATVLDVKENGILVLGDGREVRLDAVLLPYPPPNMRQYKNWPLWQQTIATLKKYVVQKTAHFHFSQRKTDRYGRLLAHVYVDGDSSTKIWIQEELIKNGLAWVFPFQTKAKCFPDLLPHEVLARKAKKGIWQHSMYQVLDAKKTYDMLHLTNRFHLVEGQVQNVAVVRGRAYLNFGKDWRTDFTIQIPKKALSQFQNHSIDIMALKDKCVRVRGWLIGLNGPMITTSHPSQIEQLPKC